MIHHAWLHTLMARNQLESRQCDLFVRTCAWVCVCLLLPFHNIFKFLTLVIQSTRMNNRKWPAKQCLYIPGCLTFREAWKRFNNSLTCTFILFTTARFQQNITHYVLLWWLPVFFLFLFFWVLFCQVHGLWWPHCIWITSNKTSNVICCMYV